MPRTAQGPIGRRRRLGTYLTIALLVPGWVLVVRLSAARPRVRAVLRDHHAIERNLYRRRLLGDRVVARGHGITPERLYRWRRILEKESMSTRAASEVRTRLIPVTVRSTPLEAPANGCVVVIDGELRVEVGDTNAVSRGWIATLLRHARDGGA